MKILEQYQELIERDPAEISYVWKIAQILLYLLCTLSGYICSILFYIIWEHAFVGNCPLWTKSVLVVATELDSQEYMNISYENWWKHVITDYNNTANCEIYFLSCFLSCVFGVVWFALFLMCGKGGHDTAIYDAPWRIVPPALVSNFIFAALTTYTTLNVDAGYEEFSNGIKDVFIELSDTYKLPDTSECEIIQMYVQMYNFHNHNVCNLFSWLQVFSGIMMWSWISGFVIVVLRVVVVNDFRICKVTIYDVLQKHTSDNSDAGTLEESNQNIEKEKVS